LLRPDEQVFEAMLTGWRNQQLARNLAFSTIEGRERGRRSRRLAAARGLRCRRWVRPRRKERADDVKVAFVADR
jgi:hypothetical protein